MQSSLLQPDEGNIAPGANVIPPSYLVEAVSTLSSGPVTAKDASLSSGGMLTAIAVNPN